MVNTFIRLRGSRTSVDHTFIGIEPTLALFITLTIPNLSIGTVKALTKHGILLEIDMGFVEGTSKEFIGDPRETASSSFLTIRHQIKNLPVKPTPSLIIRENSSRYFNLFFYIS